MHNLYTQADHPLHRLIFFGSVTSRGTALAYLIDTHSTNATYIIALNDFARCMLSYGATFFANGIVLRRGVKISLVILGACQAACWVLAIPMYVYGKRVRSFVSTSRLPMHVSCVSFRRRPRWVTTAAERTLRRLHAILVSSAKTSRHQIPPNLRPGHRLSRRTELGLAGGRKSESSRRSDSFIWSRFCVHRVRVMAALVANERTIYVCTMY